MTWWRELDPALQGDARRLIQTVQHAGGAAVITSVRRTPPTARKIERTYGVGCCTPAQHSKHADGLAFDAVITPVALARRAGVLWRQWGHHWYARDPIHFED